MTEIVNLNRARKAKARSAATAQAEANRAAFGRTKAEKLASAREVAGRERALDGVKRNVGDEKSNG